MNTIAEIIDIQIKMQKSICYRELQKLSDLKKMSKEKSCTIGINKVKFYVCSDDKYEDIINLCCILYNIKYSDLKVKSRKQPIPECIKLISVIIYKSGLNLSKLSKLLNKNHATISTAKKRAIEYLNNPKDFDNNLFIYKYAECMKSINNV